MNDLRKSWHFFREQGHTAEYALELAHAERWAAEEDVDVSWRWDQEAWDAGDAYIPSEVLGCVVTHPGGASESLWGIADPSPDYQRVVVAELTAELQYQVLAALANSVLSI